MLLKTEMDPHPVSFPCIAGSLPPWHLREVSPAEEGPPAGHRDRPRKDHRAPYNMMTAMPFQAEDCSGDSLRNRRESTSTAFDRPAATPIFGSFNSILRIDSAGTGRKYDYLTGM